MAVAKTVLKLTETDAVVKVAGTDGGATITLATDLLSTTQVVDGSPKVYISGMQWTGAANGVITIARNDVTIATLQANAPNAFEMNGQMMIPDATESLSNIIVTISGAQSELWLRLKKVGGYKSKLEEGIYGSYDDPTRVGASTTKSGSPDKV